MIVAAVEIDLLAVAPEGVRRSEELLGAVVALVVREEIAVAALLRGGAAGDDVDGHAAADQRGEGVDLLHERRRSHQSGAVGDDVFQPRGLLSHRTGDEERLRLVAGERDQHRLDPGILGVLGEVEPAVHVGLRRRRLDLCRFNPIARCLARRLRAVALHFERLRQHPVEAKRLDSAHDSSTNHGTAGGCTPCLSAHVCSAHGGVSMSR